MQGPLFEAVKGGALLGLATSISYLVIGRIAGMSGLISVLASFKFDTEYKYKLALLGGMLFASGFAYTYGGMKDNFASIQTDSPAVYLISGFLVGLGTRLGGGCTSGHGLCGLPRLSVRSITAVFLFLTTGVLAASLHLKQYIPHSSALEHSTSLDSETTAKKNHHGDRNFTFSHIIGSNTTILPSPSNSQLHCGNYLQLRIAYQRDDKKGKGQRVFGHIKCICLGYEPPCCLDDRSPHQHCYLQLWTLCEINKNCCIGGYFTEPSK